MGTGNFYYKNRCVVVSNDDYEFDNVPERGEWIGNNRSYPSREIVTDFVFHKVVLTSGYYEAGCIDYILNEASYEDFCQDNEWYTPKRRTVTGLLVKEIQRSEEQLKKMYDKAVAKEDAAVNKYIDKLMEDYGYQEYVCTARFSNGEAIYSPKKTKVHA